MIYGNVDVGERKGDRGRERRKKENKKERVMRTRWMIMSRFTC